MDVGKVTSVLERHPAIRDVRLVGSRARGEVTVLSDWDFRIDAADFDATAQALPKLVRPLDPLAQQWDRLSRRKTYMLLLPGPIKVDLLFEQPNAPEGPWQVSTATLPQIDNHFWDWILWIAAKHAAGHRDLVGKELGKLFAHLLRPMRVTRVPADVEAAIECFRAARQAYADRFQLRIATDLEGEIVRALRQNGFRV